MASLTLDPEIANAMAPFAEAMSATPKPPAGDVATRRKNSSAFAAQMASVPALAGVTRKDHHVTASDGASVLVREFRKDGAPSQNTKAIYHIHGGGMIMGSVDMFSKSVETRCLSTGYPTFSVDYRLAPEHQHPTPVEDCWAGLQWLYAHAAEFGIDPAKIIVTGESAGGGLAAGLCLLARDRALSPPVFKQILIFPMLDDRNRTPFPAIEPYAVWNNDDNITGWDALVGDKAGSADLDAVSEYAAPARAKSLAGLPRTYIDVGQLDIFVFEDMQYAARLAAANVEVELHVYPGVPHGFQMLAPGATVSKQAQANAVRAFLDA